MSFATLFEVLTPVEWAGVTQPIKASLGPAFRIYLASFILICTFISINLFISLIFRESEEAHKRVEEESTMPLTQREIMHEMRDPRDPSNLKKRLPEGTASNAAD